MCGGLCGDVQDLSAFPDLLTGAVRMCCAGEMELITCRTFIRQRSIGDASALSAYYLRNAEHLTRWEPARPAGYHRQLEWLRRIEADGADAVHLVARLQDAPQEIAAICSFTGIARGVFQACHMGLSVDAAHQGSGLMAEVAEAGIQHMFQAEGLHRIMASHLPENQRSAALLQRLGFCREGYARKYLKIAGSWRDHVLTARLAEDAGPERDQNR